MMNVPEKLEYFEERDRFLKKKQLKSGITDKVKETLKQRNMVPADLKYLPACEVKGILENSNSNAKTQTLARSPDKFQEKNI